MAVTGRLVWNPTKQKLWQERMRLVADKVPQALLVAAQSSAGMMTEWAIANKLSGQVLNRITGTLQRSVTNAQGAEIRRGDLVVGWVGVSVNYGIHHEQGFAGELVVPQHQRRCGGREGAPGG